MSYVEWHEYHQEQKYRQPVRQMDHQKVESFIATGGKITVIPIKKTSEVIAELRPKYRDIMHRQHTHNRATQKAKIYEW